MAVTGFRTRQVTVVAGARVVSVAAVAAGAWALGVAALGPSSRVASLPDFGVSSDSALMHWSPYFRRA